MDEIDRRKNNLKKDLFDTTLDHEQIFQKHIVDTPAFIFFGTNKNEEYNIRKLIASTFKVNINEVILVGSSKLGYSLSPRKDWRDFDSKYKRTNIGKDKSDLDVAIISSKLFSQLKENLYYFTSGLELEWKSNETYQKEKKDMEASLYKYMAKGWFRPDFKPQGFEIGIDNTFENLKKEIYNNTGRKLGLAIYESWFFFKEYHIANLINLTLKLETTVL